MAPPVDLDLPQTFCWTRFGTEAGEPIEQIFARKEQERRASGGTFFWGIGNSIAPAVRALVERTAAPSVLFSPIASRPRTVDVRPGRVVRWLRAEMFDGKCFDLPDDVCVTSRYSGRLAHYALVCSTAEPLRPTHHGSLTFRAMRNLLSGRPLGASQVTAVVERDPAAWDGRSYEVAIRATLTPPYFVKLQAPVDASNGAALAPPEATPLF